MPTVTRTYLELHGFSALRAARPINQPIALARRRPIVAAEYRALYDLVGERWLWRDRRIWSEQELDTYLGSPHVHVWSALRDGETVGYFDLQQREAHVVEIMY